MNNIASLPELAADRAGYGGEFCPHYSYGYPPPGQRQNHGCWPSGSRRNRVTSAVTFYCLTERYEIHYGFSH
ncbi:hypothetical protein EDWATA_01310 [Edwardsiella tarda ATCC 23685]|uniref:Uncharacterized protein n=1 Tax=Edwardsiella tarda ATCC 23685 TaxID=500638 RepID=D4F3J9_EDWTA|nr:hypothetical protein EDWATA_01310 [Edwardsiella tarda ATCC 23685]